jgi:hypothetical protein
MWVVRDGGDLYVRSVNGRGSSWFRGAEETHEARIRAGGVEKNVNLVETDDVNEAVDAAYHAKYGRRYATIVPRSSPRRHARRHSSSCPARRSRSAEANARKHAGGLGDRARLHGDELQLPAVPRRAGDGRVDPDGGRARRHLLRHRAGLRPVHQRGAGRRRARTRSRPGQDRDQVRLRPGDWHVERPRQSSRDDPQQRRALAEAASYRHDRPALPAPCRPERPDRGGRRHRQGPDRRREGEALRPLRGGRADDSPRPRRAAGHRATERVLALVAGARGGDPAHTSRSSGSASCLSVRSARDS